MTLPPAPSVEDVSPVRVPGYEILRELGRGGMGVVYQARHERLNRLAALKMILYGGHAAEGDLARFRTEAEAVARLQHPGIVQIYEIGEHNGLPYLALEFCPGGSLLNRLDGTPLPPAQAARNVEALARAVHAAHQAGIVHRDLKPGNILLAADGSLKITDFGLAKKLDSSVGQTQTGAVMGTPSYMAPEQAAGLNKEIGPVTDLYSLGVILYELLTGRPPFKAATPLDTMMQQMHQEPVPPRKLQPQVPPDLETICLKCLQKEPGKRYASAADLAEDLRRYQAGEPITARPVGALERGWRWCRRNPLVAGLTAGVAALLLMVATGATGAAIYLGGVAQRERETAAEMELLAGREREAADKERLAVAAAETERRKAEEERDRARGLQLTAQATASLTSNPGLALLLAIEGAQRAPGVLANNALRAALETGFEERTLVEGSAVLSVTFSPDGRQILSVSNNGGIRLWEAATGKPIYQVKGIPGYAQSAFFSPDGRCFAVLFATWNTKLTYRDGQVKHYTNRVVRLYETATGKPLTILRGHEDRVVAAAFSPDGKRLVTASWDHTARIWEIATGKPLVTLKKQSSSLLTAAFSPDGRRVQTVVAGGSYFTGKPSDQPNAKTEVDPLNIEPRAEGAVSGETMSHGMSFADAPVIAASWDAATGKELTHAGRNAIGLWPVLGMIPTFRTYNFGACSPDGRMVSVGSAQQGEVYLWDTTSEQPVVLLRTGEPIASEPAFSPDSRRLITVSPGSVQLWDVKTNKQLRSLLRLEQPFRLVRWSPDEKHAAVADNRSVRVWDTATGEIVAVLRGHEQVIRAFAYRRDGQRLVTASDDGTIRTWRVAPSREHVVVLQGHKGPVNALAFSQDGRRVVTGSADRTARLWDGDSGRQLALLRQPPSTDWEQIHGAVRGTSFSPDGRFVLTLAEDAKARKELSLFGVKMRDEVVPFTPVQLWDAGTGKEGPRLKGHVHQVRMAVFSPDGRCVLTVEGDYAQKRSFKTTGMGGSMNSSSSLEDGKGRTARIFEAATGKQLVALPEHPDRITAAAFSPDGRRVLTVANTGNNRPNVRLWDADTGQEVLSFPNRFWEPWAQFSPDGRQILTISATEGRLWHAATGKESGRLLAAPTRFFTAINSNQLGWSDAYAAFSPDSRRVAIICEDRTVQIWDTQAATLLTVLRGHSRELHSVQFSPDGRFIVTASADETARIWQADTGKEWYTLSGHRGAVVFATFSPDSRRVATASADETARIWLVDPLPAAVSRKPRELTTLERERFEVGSPREHLQKE
jgi:WD40 repeat protein